MEFIVSSPYHERRQRCSTTVPLTPAQRAGAVRSGLSRRSSACRAPTAGSPLHSFMARQAGHPAPTEDLAGALGARRYLPEWHLQPHRPRWRYLGRAVARSQPLRARRGRRQRMLPALPLCRQRAGTGRRADPGHLWLASLRRRLLAFALPALAPGEIGGELAAQAVSNSIARRHQPAPHPIRSVVICYPSMAACAAAQRARWRFCSSSSACLAAFTAA